MIFLSSQNVLSLYAQSTDTGRQQYLQLQFEVVQNPIQMSSQGFSDNTSCSTLYLYRQFIGHTLQIPFTQKKPKEVTRMRSVF